MRKLRYLAMTAVGLVWSGLVSAGDALEEARVLAEEGQLQAAVEQLDAVAAKDELPMVERAGALHLKGMLLLGSGDLPGATEVFHGMMHDYPQLPAPYNNLAAIYASEGDLETARQLLLRLIERHPDHAVALENLGDIYTKLAFDSYQRAQALDPGQVTISPKLRVIESLFGPAT